MLHLHTHATPKRPRSRTGADPRHGVIAATAFPGTTLRLIAGFLMLALATQGTAALMQRLRPAHYHQPLSQPGVDHAAGHVHDDIAAQTTTPAQRFRHAPSPHAWFPAFGRGDHAHEVIDHRHAHDDPSGLVRSSVVERHADEHADAHRHAGIGRHRHAPEDRSVVYVENAGLDPALPAVINYGSDGFVLALPSSWRLIDPRDADNWLPVIVRGAPPFHTGAPERPPRFLSPLSTPLDRTRSPAHS